MNTFLNDLKRAVDECAKTLRKNVVSENLERRNREQRQEAQFVSEVYHNLRNNGYESKSLFMEISYPTVEIEGGKKISRPDLVFESEGYEHIVEFKVFWEGDIEKNSSKIREIQKKSTLTRYYKRMLLYSLMQDKKIKCLYLIFAYDGPSNRENGIVFNTKEFDKSISDYILELKSREKESKLPIELITA